MYVKNAGMLCVSFLVAVRVGGERVITVHFELNDFAQSGPNSVRRLAQIQAAIRLRHLAHRQAAVLEDVDVRVADDGAVGAGVGGGVARCRLPPNARCRAARCRAIDNHILTDDCLGVVWSQMPFGRHCERKRRFMARAASSENGSNCDNLHNSSPFFAIFCLKQFAPSDFAKRHRNDI